MSPAEPRRDRVAREVYLLVELLSQRVTDEMEEVCRAEGLSTAQYSVLWVLCLQGDPEGLPQGMISDGLVTRASDVSRLVSRLEEAGLVERSRSNADRRIVRIRPTPRGRAAFARATARVKALHRVQFGDLVDDELEMLHRLLNRAFWSGADAVGEEFAS